MECRIYCAQNSLELASKWYESVSLEKSQTILNLMSQKKELNVLALLFYLDFLIFSMSLRIKVHWVFGPINVANIKKKKSPVKP